MRWLKRIALGFAVYFLITLAVAAALAAFFHPKAPKAMASVTEPFATMDLTGLPALVTYRARDGANLSYRVYPAKGGPGQGGPDQDGPGQDGPGQGDQMVVLIHGSVGSSQDMHRLALALQQQTGSTVLVPDLRGHGANRPHGDIAYVGQLDDDMEDFMRVIKPAYPGRKWTLLGFSSGAGFALRIAAEPQGREFDRYILLSPFLRYNAPTARQDAAKSKNDDAHWYSVSIPRIVGLSILGTFGIHHFDGLTVISFPVPDNLESVTASYSLRLQDNFEPHADYRADIRKSQRPMQVFVGSADELFYPDRFAAVFHAERPEVPVTLLPGMTHSDMITKPLAIQTVVQAVRQSGASRSLP
jgi:alpha-beta hydrolase superfamily lysophospholipase